MRKALRWLVFLLACAALGLVFGVAFAYVYLRQSLPELEGEIPTSGYAVPHIFAIASAWRPKALSA